MKYLVVAVVSLLFHYGHTQTYKAAVIEYYPTTDDTPYNTILKNLDQYRGFIEKAKDQSVDIIVFPEYGLTTIVTDPEEYAIDVSNATEKVIIDLVDMARDHQMYIVVNLLEKVKEDNRKTKYYNTNLVFNKDGKIVAKYRKINLYQEPNLTPGNETVSFYADFGVKFGIFTCFDIMFYNPSRKIFEFENVTDVIYPAAWYSTMPFYTSLSVQHGYAVSTGVNLLAANYANAKEGHGGSGIYLRGGGIAEVYIDSSPSSKPIVQSIQTSSNRQLPTNCPTITPHALPGFDKATNISDYKTFSQFKSSDYKFKDIDLSQEKVSTTICDGDFCCNFSVTIRQPANTDEYYKLVAYDGEITVDDRDLNIRFCSLVACETSSKSSCGARINGTTHFTRVSVEGVLESDNTTFYVPVTLNYNLKPIKEISYCETVDNNSSTVRVSSYIGQEGVLAFGIVGRSNALDTGINSGIRHTGFFILLYVVVAKFVLM